jgi:iron(III) transport system substrate-binding protein
VNGSESSKVRSKRRGRLIEWIFVIVVMSVLAWLAKDLNSTNPKRVIVYAAQDQVYSEPILHEFENQTGIKVEAVYDSEAVKTVGLANRLLAERGHPQCDVFWGNEEMRTRQLAAQNVFRVTNGWAALGYRSRRIVINTNFVSLGSRRGNEADQTSSPTNPPPHVGGYEAPRSLVELTNAIWHGKVALAYPQFGTTSTHFHALKQLWGEGNWLAWCRALAANKPFVVDGNSVVVKFVGCGEAWIGLTDSDDIAAGQHEGMPIAELPLTKESLLIPNTVAVIRNAPHPANAQKLFEYLQSRKVADELVKANALESATNATDTSTLKPDWDALLRDLGATTKQLNAIFLR